MLPPFEKHSKLCFNLEQIMQLTGAEVEMALCEICANLLNKVIKYAAKEGRIKTYTSRENKSLLSLQDMYEKLFIDHAKDHLHRILPVTKVFAKEDKQRSTVL